MQISKTHPSNIFKFCPACGHNGFLFDGKKAFKCIKCDFKYYINEAAATAAILVSPDGRIVLTRRKTEPRAGYFDLPGGFVDIAESAEDGLIREIKEELGLEVTSMTFLASFPNEYLFGGISYFTCDLAFICQVSDLSKMIATDDVAEAVLVNPFEIDYSTISFPSIVHILKAYQANCSELPF